VRSPFEQQDRVRAAQEAKSRECVERLSRILAKEFDFEELKFCWGYGGLFPSSILVEAFELARGMARTR
jgi:hypothetical protein